MSTFEDRATRAVPPVPPVSTIQDSELEQSGQPGRPVKLYVRGKIGKHWHTVCNMSIVRGDVLRGLVYR